MLKGTLSIVPIKLVPSTAPALPIRAQASKIVPALPVGPITPAPVEPVTPIAPVSPVEPISPVAPTLPVEPVVPVIPIKPVEPILPVEPVVPKPVTPVTPMLYCNATITIIHVPKTIQINIFRRIIQAILICIPATKPLDSC